jgi:hypothetical protein
MVADVPPQPAAKPKLPADRRRPIHQGRNHADRVWLDGGAAPMCAGGSSGGVGMADTGKVFHPHLSLAEALHIAEAVAAHYDHKSLLGQTLLKPILEDLEARGAQQSTMGPHLLAALNTLGRTSMG